MKIMNITPAYSYVKNNSSNNMAFKGNVGRYDARETGCSSDYIDYTVTHNYYPHKGETLTKIEEAKKAMVNDFDKQPLPRENGRFHIEYRHEVEIPETLPFSESEQKTYNEAPWKLSLAKRVEIGNYLREIKREKTFNKYG